MANYFQYSLAPTASVTVVLRLEYKNCRVVGKSTRLL